MRKRLILGWLAGVLGATAAQAPGHPFDPSDLVPAADSFIVETRATTHAPWRTVGGIIQTVARDTNAIRIAVEVVSLESKQRVEMALHPKSLAPLAHWERLVRKGLGDAIGEVMFSDGHARGAFILSKGLIDIPLDSGIIDDDAATALLPTLPLDSAREFSFRTFASPGELQLTRVFVQPKDTTIDGPIGRFTAHHLLVMSRDTSHVYVSTTRPKRIVFIRLANGLQQMVPINKR